MNDMNAFFSSFQIYSTGPVTFDIRQNIVFHELQRVLFLNGGKSSKEMSRDTYHFTLDVGMPRYKSVVFHIFTKEMVKFGLGYLTHPLRCKAMQFQHPGAVSSRSYRSNASAATNHDIALLGFDPVLLLVFSVSALESKKPRL